jgi:hypothetical protein
LGGGLGCWGCCGSGGYMGFTGILGVRSMLSDMYFVLSVRAWGCLLQGLGSFGYNFVGRRVVMLFVVLLLPILLVFYNTFESLLVTLG